MADGAWDVVSEQPAGTAPVTNGGNPWDVVSQAPAKVVGKPVPTAGDVVNALVHAPVAWAQNFGQDYASRATDAMNALKNDVQSYGQPSVLSAIPFAREGKILLDLANDAAVPFMAAGDQIVGRPVEAATGGRVQHQTATDVASAVVPLVGEVSSARAAGQAARAAGMSQRGYEALQTTSAATRNVLRAPPPKPATPVAAPTAPLRARFSPASAEQQAANIVASRAADLPAVRESLAGAPQELVPGAVPTTFQQTGDMGLGSLEREQAIKNPVDFNQRRADQNAARVSALATIQAGADPNDVAKAFRQHLDDLDAQTQAAIEAAQKAGQIHVDATDAATQARLNDAAATARQSGAAIGGMAAPETYGEQTRTAIGDAERAAKAREGALWSAVDPNGDLTGNTVQTSSAAKQIASELPPTARPMQGEEAAVFEAAQSLPALAPVRDLVALRSRISDAMREELRVNGSSQAYRRLTQLRGAIQDNLSTTIGHQVALDDAAVARGTMAPEEALASRLRAEANGFFARRQGAAGTGSGAGSVGIGPGKPDAILGVPGAEGSPNGGSGVPAGNPGIPSTPTFDADAASRLAVATDATKQRARTFGLGPVGQVLQKAGPSDVFRLTDGQVPAKFFHPGPAAADHMRAALAASPMSLPILQDYAAMTLRREAMTPDGILDPAKFARWQAKYADAIRALPPETKARFATAADAATAVADAGAARAEALKAAQAKAALDVASAITARKAAMTAAQRSPAGRIAPLTQNQDISRTVGGILEGRTAGADMRDLASAARADPNAFQGLRQAVADHIASRFLGNTEAATSGVGQIKADAFQTFLRRNGDALSEVFSPQEMSNLRAIAADIQRSKRSENAVKLPGGSNTPQDLVAITKHKAGQSVLSILGAVLGGTAGHALGPAGTELGSAAGAIGGGYLQVLRSQGIERVDQLVTKAMLDPTFARTLLDKVPDQAAPGAAKITTSKLRAAIRALIGTSGATNSAQNPGSKNALR